MKTAAVPILVVGLGAAGLGLLLAHISHINPAGLAVISNSDTQCSRIAKHSGYHES